MRISLVFLALLAGLAVQIFLMTSIGDREYWHGWYHPTMVSAIILVSLGKMVEVKTQRKLSGRLIQYLSFFALGIYGSIAAYLAFTYKG